MSRIEFRTVTYYHCHLIISADLWCGTFNERGEEISDVKVCVIEWISTLTPSDITVCRPSHLVLSREINSHIRRMLPYCENARKVVGRRYGQFSKTALRYDVRWWDYSWFCWRRTSLNDGHAHRDRTLDRMVCSVPVPALKSVTPLVSVRTTDWAEETWQFWNKKKFKQK